jgi:hypothetical protein
VVGEGIAVTAAVDTAVGTADGAPGEQDANRATARVDMSNRVFVI